MPFRFVQSALAISCLLLPGRVYEPPEEAVRTGNCWGLIVVGISGDEAHAKLFERTTATWRAWLADTLQLPADRVLLVGVDPAGPPATAEAIQQAFARLGESVKPGDRLWVFTLGHGNGDNRQASLHVSGPDPSAQDFRKWLGQVKCREQVVWLTHSSSVWFVKPLSERGRIVIAATAADDERNETEFPHALSTVMGRPIKLLDLDHDGDVSVAELFTATTREVQHRFDADKRLPTEHAQLDDNGDGRGTEQVFPAPEQPVENAAPAKPQAIDGAEARRVKVPYPPPKPGSPP